MTSRNTTQHLCRTTPRAVKAIVNRLAHACKNSALQLWAIGIALGAGMAAQEAQAGVLSRNLCRPYRQLVDNELFITIAVIAGVILVLAWKLAPSGTYLQKAVGLLAAVVLGLNLENLFQVSFGTGLAC